MSKSEFGRGYATCLIQFVFHEPRLASDEAIYAKLRAEHPDLFSPTRVAEMWMNGACDHLHDLLRPRRGIAVTDWQDAKVIRGRAQEIGHAWRTDANGTPDECRRLIAASKGLLSKIGVATFDEAFAWDTAHGLRPSEGYSATCVKPIPIR